jgi:hypothetical protein
MPAQVGRGAKVSKGPRALGLLELTPNGKAHLIPITILIDGKYYDASAYKAAPVPMALWSETVYEAVRTGVSRGLFTVTRALQRKDAKDANEWMAEGTWQSADSIKAKVAKKPAALEPRGMNEDEGPPVLRRADAEKPKSTEPPAAPTTPSQTPSAPVASPNATPAAAPQAPPATSGSTSSPPATPSQQEQAHEDKPPEDKDRPELKRGKPKPVPVAKEEPRKTTAASAKTAGPSATTTPTSAATNSGSSSANQIQLIPAISDPNGPDPLPYTFNLKPEEEQQFRKKMLAMAADEVRARAGQSVHAPSQRGKGTAVKPVQPDFEDVQLRVFDLADINEPELVLTANARMPQRSREKQRAGTDLQNKDLQNKDLQNKDLRNKDLQNKDLQNKDLQYTITLVVREDVNGEFHKALANVTDTQHLDVLPRLELIDAVDVDGDGRGELLFRQVSDVGSAFVVYRVIGDRLYPLFQGTLGR